MAHDSHGVQYIHVSFHAVWCRENEPELHLLPLPQLTHGSECQKGGHGDALLHALQIIVCPRLHTCTRSCNFGQPHQAYQIELSAHEHAMKCLGNVHAQVLSWAHRWTPGWWLLRQPQALTYSCREYATTTGCSRPPAGCLPPRCTVQQSNSLAAACSLMARLLWGHGLQAGEN